MLELKLKLSHLLCNKYKKEGAVYRPDFIIYDLNERQYQLFWHQLKNHPRDQLYTDGLQVYKVSWLESLFESIKGWFGFENHCQTNKVELTLGKIAYAGYLKGYHPDELTQFNEPPIISQHFSSLVNSARQDKTSEEIQDELMIYFTTYSDYFLQLDKPSQGTFSFGQSFITDFPQFIPGLDPQDANLINKTILNINHRNYSFALENHIKLSRFAERYASFLVQNREYDKALKWSSQVVNQYEHEFIQFFLNPKNPDRAIDLAKAIKLIHSLATKNQKDISQYIDLLTLEEQLEHIDLKSYSELRKTIATIYINKATVEKNNNFLIKLIWNDNRFKYIEHALKLDPTILETHSSIHELSNLYKNEFIDFFLNLKDPERQFSLPKAVKLINSLNLKNQEYIMQYIQKLTYEEQLQYIDVKTYPILRKTIAEIYLNKAREEKEKSIFSKMFLNDYSFNYLKQAQNLDPAIFENEENLILKKEWINYQFDEAIKNENFQEAYNLYTLNLKIKFENTDNLNQLKIYCLEAMESSKQEIQNALEKKNTDLAYKLSVESKDMAKIIDRITPSEKSSLTAIVNYVSTLIEIDKIKHNDIKNANMEELEKADLLLKKYFMLDKSLNPIYNQLLLRKINCCIEHLKVPILFDYHDSEIMKERKQFIEKNKKWIDTLKDNLNLFITINENNQSKELRPTLAKVHFILGDVLEYFNSNTKNSLTHIKKATDLMPDNLYYQYYYHFLNIDIDKEERIKWYQKAKQTGVGDEHYIDSINQRWFIEKSNHCSDIHEIPEQNNNGFLVNLFKWSGI